VRRLLLDAALHVFAEVGYETASIDQVAAAAGFTKGAVYSNFATKDELFLALMEERFTARVVASRQALSARGTGSEPQELLAEIGRRLTEALSQDREWQLLFLDYWRRVVRNDQARQQFVEHRRRLRASVEAVIRTLPYGEREIGLSIEEQVTLVLALSNGLAIERLTDPESVPDHLFGRVLALPLGGLPPARPGTT
jgi:AcrR family transcriptional regulator